jgi:hypothetical protein
MYSHGRVKMEATCIHLVDYMSQTIICSPIIDFYIYIYSPFLWQYTVAHILAPSSMKNKMYHQVSAMLLAFKCEIQHLKFSSFQKP